MSSQKSLAYRYTSCREVHVVATNMEGRVQRERERERKNDSTNMYRRLHKPVLFFVLSRLVPEQALHIFASRVVACSLATTKFKTAC